MIGIIKYFNDLPYFCAKGTGYIGGLGLDSSKEYILDITEDNISKIVYVVYKVNTNLSLIDNEEVEAYFMCKLKIKCGYPFCGNSCVGNDEYVYIPSKEKREY